MKAGAWVRNPDPQPRGLVFKMRMGASTWWAGIVTVRDAEFGIRSPLNGASTAVLGDTREEALAKLQPVLEKARLRHGHR